MAIGAKALYDFGKAALKTASDLEEIQNVTNTVFGSMSSDINNWSKSLIDDFGLGEMAAKEYSSYMGAMLKSSGVAGEAVRDMSKDITLLTADMASFYNQDTDEMFQKVMSAMSGQTMPLRKLGINMNIANLEAFALSQGIRKSWQEMNQAEQVMLRYNYLMNVTGDAQGDFARNADNWAHSTKILGEKWKEFMGIMGMFIKEVAVPLVHFLIKIVDGLTAMARGLGRVYTLITGKELSVEANTNIGDAAWDAAEGENELANGIDKAAKAAKKALAPFDELNILQKDLGTGGGSGSGLPGAINDGGLNTTMSTNQVDDGWKIKVDDEEPKKFFAWLTDKWNNVKQMLSIPIAIAAPVFSAIPSPVYNPNWGLTPPLVPSPVFEPIPNPVYEPNWGLAPQVISAPSFEPILNPVYEPNWNLDPPKIMAPVFPAIDYSSYSKSLESIKKDAEEAKTKLESIQIELSKRLEKETQRATENMKSGFSTAWNTIETNYKKHKENVGVIAVAISTSIVSNINEGLTKTATNINKTITNTQENLQTWGRNLGSIASETSKAFAMNISEGLKASAQNTVSFANDQLSNMKSWGSSMLSIAGETAKGFASNMVSGFRSTWDSFKSLMSSMGERVSGWWSEQSVATKTTIAVGGAVIGAGALALAAPVAVPYAAATLGGLAAIPALATGGITNGPMLAMIGDNPGGKEVVSPLDGLLDMIVDAMDITNANNDGDVHLTIKIGEDTITDKIISNIKRESRIHGTNVVEV